MNTVAWMTLVTAAAAMPLSAGSSLGIPCTAAIVSVRSPAGAGEHAEPPTDEQVAQAAAKYNAKIKALQEAREFNPGMLGPVADEALQGIDIASMSAGQMRSLFESANLHMYTTRAGEFDQRLAALSAEPTPEGALAAVQRLGFLGSANVEKQHAVIASMLDHPGLAGVLKDPEVWHKFSAFSWFVQPKAVKELAGRLVGLAPMMPERMPVMSAMGALALYDAVAEAGMPAAEREPLRARVVAVLKSARDRFDPADPSLKNISFGGASAGEYMDQQARRLDGPSGRGTLVGGPAPALEFIWASGDRPWKSLSDLKGKVVVLDFWATWCGPCVGSFPKMKEVAQRYRGFDLEIVGVTSIQGSHHGEGKTIDCKGDPKREMALMAEYITAKGLTWPIVFSSQPVFNGDYGVRGIPHVVLIDAQGKVRRSGLSFHDSEKLTAEIDALLREAGLRVP